MSTQRRVEQDREHYAFEAPGTGGFFLWKKSFGNCAMEGYVLGTVVRLQGFPTGQISIGTRFSQNEWNAISLTAFRDPSNGVTAWSFHRYGMIWDATNSLNSSSRCQWRICHGSGILSQQLPSSSPLLSSAFRWKERDSCSNEPNSAAFNLVTQSALPQVPMGGLPWDGKATWPRKFVYPAHRTKRGLRFLKTINSLRFITSGKMNTHSRDLSIKAA